MEGEMGQRAELKEAHRLYEPAPLEEMTPLQRRDPKEAPSAIWTAWVLLVLLLAALTIWSGGPSAYEFTLDADGAPPPPPSLLGP
jgi:hypothetical protein